MHCSAIRQAETDRKPVCEPDFVKKEEAMRKSYEMDMTRGPLLRSILIFTLPLLLSGVLQLLFNATDIVVVGQFAGANAMASVGSTTSLFNLLINAFIGISVGANVLVARYCGEKNYDGVQQTVQTSLLTGLVGGVILVVLGIVLARPMLTLMKTPDEVIEGAVLYMRVYFIGMPATMIYNFGAAALKNAKIRWSITDGSGKAIAKGSLKSQTVGTDGVFPVGEFSAPLGKVRGPQKLTVHLNVGEKTSNSWDIWVYPRNAQLMQSDTEVLYTTEFGEQAKQYLAAGKKVVLTPAPNKVKGRKSTFHNHFWNPIMFAWAPMTIGCLIHAEQPVFADFPTSYHTDWQWWDILENAKVIEMQQTPRQLRPFIQVIDSFDNNEKLGIGFEARVGGGKLLVLAVDTKKKMDQRPATRQLLESIDRYVRSDRFAPEVTLDESFITSFMR